ncbi:MAG: NUDIX hydrolase [Planctomycetes bacterium]|nr:NUDIX hydrolase [Planctomycetota bacterium]MCB9905379.1 NUDIX hydrolase [Planctomycetota bacterium]
MTDVNDPARPRTPEGARLPEPFEPYVVDSSERIYDSYWCGLRCDQLRLEDGSLQEYHVFEIANAVAVVPLTKDGELLMLAHYRHPAGTTGWETPAGRIHAGEDPADAARRELREETGYEAGRLVPLPGFHPTGGISAHYAHAFCALDCERRSEPELDPCERLRLARMPLAEAERLLDGGAIVDAFTALPLAYVLRKRAAGEL